MAWSEQTGDQGPCSTNMVFGKKSQTDRAESYRGNRLLHGEVEPVMWSCPNIIPFKRRRAGAQHLGLPGQDTNRWHRDLRDVGDRGRVLSCCDQHDSPGGADDAAYDRSYRCSAYLSPSASFWMASVRMLRSHWGSSCG
jgi:hypothetical protein